MPRELFDTDIIDESNLHIHIPEHTNKLSVTPLINYSFKGGKAVNENGTYEANIINCTYHETIDSQNDVIEFDRDGSSIQIPSDKLPLHTSTIAVIMDFKFTDNNQDRINLFEGGSVPFVVMLLRREGKYYPAVSVNLSNCWYTSTAENDAVNPDEWCNLCGLFTGEEIYIFKNNICIDRRVFKDAKMTAVGNGNFFIGTWVDGRRNQLKGMVSNFILWDTIPNNLMSEIENAINAGKGEINSKYLDLGGEGSFLGKKTGIQQIIRKPTFTEKQPKGRLEDILDKIPEKPRPVLGKFMGVECEFSNGRIYWSRRTGAYEVHGDILRRYKELKGPLGKLGFPRSDEINGRVAGSRVSAFENGAIYWSGATGSHEILNYIYAKYINLGGEKSFLGLPKAQEITLSNGVAMEFEGGRIYYSERTGAHEVHGEILQRYLSFTEDQRNSFGFPVSDEMDILDSNGKPTGKKLSKFETGTIFWSDTTGAHIVYGAILQRYIELDGPLGKLGMPLTNEEGVADSDIRYNDFENGIIVWKPEWGAKDIINLQLRFGEVVSGQIDDGIGWGSKDRSAELITYTHVSINGNFIDNGTRRPGGHAGDSYNINQVYQIPNIKHDTELYFRVRIYDWDKMSDNDYLGSVEKCYNILSLWGLENGSYGIFSEQPLTDKGGDAYNNNSVRLSFSIALPDAPDPSKCFRDQYWWWFHNFSGPNELSRDFYANTFTDVEIIGDNIWEKILNPIDTLIYELAYKNLCKEGNCFGMSLEALYVQNHSSLCTIPLSKYPSLKDALRTIINRKHGYQVGADAVVWAMSKILSCEAVSPKTTLERVRSRIDRGDYPIITMMSLSKGSGHAVLAYKYEDNRIYVADPNCPFNSSPGTEDVGYIEVFDNDTFQFNTGSSIGYQSGDCLSGLLPDTYMMEIPFHVVSSQPATPGFFVLLGLAAILGGVLLFAGDAECEQITCGKSNFYDYKTGKKRISMNGIQGMVKLPLYDFAENQPDLYALRGEIPDTFTFNLKGRSNGFYKKSIATFHNNITVSAPISINEKDTISLEGTSTSRPTLTMKTSGSPKDITCSYHTLHDTKGIENVSYDISLQATGKEASIGIDTLGGSLIVSQAGSLKPIRIDKECVEGGKVVRTSITLTPEKENEIIKISDFSANQNTNEVLIEKYDSLTGLIINRTQGQYR